MINHHVIPIKLKKEEEEEEEEEGGGKASYCVFIEIPFVQHKRGKIGKIFYLIVN